MPLYTDQLNRLIEIPAFPKRIISLVPSQTELLFDLGLEDGGGQFQLVVADEFVQGGVAEVAVGAVLDEQKSDEDGQQGERDPTTRNEGGQPAERRGGRSIAGGTRRHANFLGPRSARKANS